MRLFITIVVLLVALPIGVIGFLKASPAQLAAGLRMLGGGVLLAIGTLLSTRGLALVGGPLALFGFMMIARGLGMAAGGGGGLGTGFGRKQKTDGQTSQVRTTILLMELDHDTGDMDGEVLAGNLAGKRLSDLQPVELMSLMDECITAGDQSQALLEAYLDRHHSQWREATGNDEQSQESRGPTTGTSGAMSHVEALDILGLEEGASHADIRAAHRNMMKKYHPDHGGSDYLAARINTAKEVLISD